MAVVPGTATDDAAPAERAPRWWLALLVGLAMAVAVNVYTFASDYYFVSSRLTFGYMPMAAMAPFAVFMMLVVPVVALVARFVAPEYPRRIRTPILSFTCGREEIVSNNAIERFVGNLNNASLIAVQGAKHELLMERDVLREQFWRAFDAFIPGEIQV